MELLYEDLTYKIRGVCFSVYNELGGLFREKIVDRALTEELLERGLKVDNQKRIDVYYKNKKVGVYIPDKIINGIVILEIKCKPVLSKNDEEQFWKYLKGTEYRLGLLINFGAQQLEIKRIICDNIRNKNATK